MDYVTLGYNFRMSDITAALGIAQLKKVERIIEMRRHNAETLSAKLCQIAEIEVPHPPERFFHVYQMYTVRVKGGQEKRDALSTHLVQRGIMTRVYFPPVHFTSFYKDNLAYDCKLPITERLAQQVLTLPMYPGLSEDELNYIADSIASFYTTR
jgi:perosamine synthetase